MYKNKFKLFTNNRHSQILQLFVTQNKESLEYFWLNWYKKPEYKCVFHEGRKNPKVTEKKFHIKDKFADNNRWD